MKYWRGYLVALILSVAAWALLQFAASHMVLMDMVYPYMTRLVQTNLATWSGGAAFCIWQLAVLVLTGGIAASIVLMVVLKWNPIQWFGWVMAAISVVVLLNTGLQGMNQYTGSIAEDMRFKNGDVTVLSVEDAAEHYLKNAQNLVSKVQKLDYSLEALTEKAPNGFENLTYKEHYAIFAGSTLPVKELSWSGYYTAKGITGVTVAVTGEAAVNTQTPPALLPYAICREMCSRMSISKEPDVEFAAIAACIYNDDPRYQYAGYLMAYIQCVEALKQVESTKAQAAVGRLEKAPNKSVSTDLSLWYDFTAKRVLTDTAGQLLTNWYIHTVVSVKQREEAKKENDFDPTNAEDPRLSGVVG